MVAIDDQSSFEARVCKLTVDEKLAKYNETFETIRLLLNEASTLVRGDSQAQQKQYMEVKVKLAQAEMLYKKSIEKTDIVKGIRHKIDKIQEGHGLETIEKSIEDPMIFIESLYQLDGVKNDLFNELEKIKAEHLVRSEMNSIKVAKYGSIVAQSVLQATFAADPEKDVRTVHNLKKRTHEMMNGNEDVDSMQVGHAISEKKQYVEKAVQTDRKSFKNQMNSTEDLELELSSMARGASRVKQSLHLLAPIMQLPKQIPGSKSILSELEWNDKYLTQMQDGGRFDDDLMEMGLRDALAKYDQRCDSDCEAKHRSHSILPPAMIHYYIDGKIHQSSSRGMIDPLKFVEATYDVFARQDLYFTAQIKGHQPTAVVRNVAASITRILNLYKGGNAAEKPLPKSRRPEDRLKEELENECVLIIFDSDYNHKDHKHIHQTILGAVKGYLLAAARQACSNQLFKSVADIQVQLHTAAVPSRVNYGKNNCGPFAIKYLFLYLDNTEKCCREVFPLGDPNDAYWQCHRRPHFRHDVRIVICPHYPHPKVQQVSNSQSSVSGTNQ